MEDGEEGGIAAQPSAAAAAAAAIFQQPHIFDGNINRTHAIDNPVANGAPSDLPAVQPSSDSDPADRNLDGESGQDGEGAPFLPPIPEQEGVAPDEVIPTGPGSEGYAAVAARDPNEEKQAEPQRPDYSAVSAGSLDLGSSEDTSDPRHQEEELSAKIRPKAKPLRLPKVCTTTKHMQTFPPSHPFSS